MYSVLFQYVFLLTSYPLARWILPHIKSKQNALILHIVLGVAACTFFFRERIILALIMITVGYYILDSNPYTVFAVSFFMNTVIHFVQLVWPVHHKISNLTMIVFYKIVATSFNLEDGRKIKQQEKQLDKRQRNFALLQKPTFFEWLSYCFTPFGSISNSFYEYKLFDYLLNIGNNPNKASDKSKSKALLCLLRSLVYSAIYYCFRHYFSLDFYKSEFFLSLNFFVRILLVLFLGIIIFSKDFMLWKAVDAGLYAAGFEDSGFATETDFSSLTFEFLLSTKTIKEWSGAFNYTNELFWSNYLTLRGPESGLGPTVVYWIMFFAKPIYKGLYGGILLASFEKKLFEKAEKVLMAVVPRFTKSFWPVYIFAQAAMTLNRASMRFKTTYTFFYVNEVINYSFWILSAVLVVAGFFLVKDQPKAEEKKDKVEEKKDDDEHIKKE